MVPLGEVVAEPTKPRSELYVNDRTAHRWALQGLHPALLSSLQSAGYSEMFPVQLATWKFTCGGLTSLHDIYLCAPTGSGKTLAYSLPLLNSLAW